MSKSSVHSAKMASYNRFQYTSLVIFISTLAVLVTSLPLSDPDADITSEIPSTTTLSYNDTNETQQDLYVIRQTVYEVGILTNHTAYADEDYDESTTLRNEKVQITYFNGGGPNGQDQIDFSKIPLPLQTNISGQQYTGFVPAADVQNFPIVNPTDRLSVVPIPPTAIVSFSKNVSTSDPKTLKELLESLPPYFHINGSIAQGGNYTDYGTRRYVKRSVSESDNSAFGPTVRYPTPLTSTTATGIKTNINAGAGSSTSSISGTTADAHNSDSLKVSSSIGSSGSSTPSTTSHVALSSTTAFTSDLRTGTTSAHGSTSGSTTEALPKISGHSGPNVPDLAYSSTGSIYITPSTHGPSSQSTSGSSSVQGSAVGSSGISSSGPFVKGVAKRSLADVFSSFFGGDSPSTTASPTNATSASSSSSSSSASSVVTTEKSVSGSVTTSTGTSSSGTTAKAVAKRNIADVFNSFFGGGSPSTTASPTNATSAASSGSTTENSVSASVTTSTHAASSVTDASSTTASPTKSSHDPSISTSSSSATTSSPGGSTSTINSTTVSSATTRVRYSINQEYIDRK